MPSEALRERLQPALLDRLVDNVASVVGEFSERRRVLMAILDSDEKRADLDRLLAREDLERRLLRRELEPALAGLPPDQDELLQRLLELEVARRLEVVRSSSLSMRELRAAVLRDLGQLLNSENLETLLVREDGQDVPVFAGLEHARASVLNYGIPALAGRIRTNDDCEELARGLTEAIQRCEPRLRDVEVTAETEVNSPDALARSPVTFLIRGELWGYPLPETLRLRTLLDLEEGRATILPLSGESG